METNDKDDVLQQKIMEGLRLSYQRLLETKRRNNQELVIMKDGKIITFKP
ncbi:MAG: hypothetical protein LBS54_04495 [Dysgonamonadaceae bacterium]|jgi:hypothetical protein|nr:hypothetical protein [Dysgonamonadaceae bacterium]